MIFQTHKYLKSAFYFLTSSLRLWRSDFCWLNTLKIAQSPDMKWCKVPLIASILAWATVLVMTSVNYFLGMKQNQWISSWYARQFFFPVNQIWNTLPFCYLPRQHCGICHSLACACVSASNNKMSSYIWRAFFLQVWINYDWLLIGFLARDWTGNESHCTRWGYGEGGKLCAVMNGFVQFIRPISGSHVREINKAKAWTSNPRHHSVLGICLKGSMIDSDLACPQFRGNE